MPAGQAESRTTSTRTLYKTPLVHIHCTSPNKAAVRDVWEFSPGDDDDGVVSYGISYPVPC